MLKMSYLGTFLVNCPFWKICKYKRSCLLRTLCWISAWIHQIWQNLTFSSLKWFSLPSVHIGPHKSQRRVLQKCHIKRIASVTIMNIEQPYIPLSPLVKMALKDNFYSKDIRDFARSYKYPFPSTA